MNGALRVRGVLLRSNGTGLFQIANDALGELARLTLPGVEDQLRRLGAFIRRIDAGEVLDLAGFCLAVQPLGIALDADFERRIDENLDEPTPLAAASDQVAAWLESPGVTLLAEAPGYWDILEPVLNVAKVSGPRIHDARIAALCLHHGVRELWSADRDVSRFPGLPVRNPLVEP